MIFVTIGSGIQDFKRLLRKMDDVSQKFDEEIVMQIAASDYTPQHSKYFRFLPKDEIDQYYINSRLIVSHAGVGSIITASRYNKKIILVPRLKEFGELIDDHQLELAKCFEAEGYNVVWNIDDLSETITKVLNQNTILPSYNKSLIDSLKHFLEYK